MLQYISGSAAQTEEIGKALGQKLNSPCIVCFYGDLGAGKTTLIRGLCRGIGYNDEVSSPTFAIVHEYHGGRLPIYHFDMYRVTSEEDLYSCGYYDYEGSGILAVEWCENIENALPNDTVKVTMSYTETEDQRLICIEGVDSLDYVGN